MTKQNALNAGEYALAAKEMTAHAEYMKSMVADLFDIIGETSENPFRSQKKEVTK